MGQGHYIRGTEAQRPRGSVGQKRGVVGRRRAAEGGGVASPRPLEKECTIERAPTWVRPAANDDLGIAGSERVGMVMPC